MKLCTGCKVIKDTSNFSLDKRSPDGLQYKCKQCQKIWRNLNKEKRSKQSKQYREENKESIKKVIRKWRMQTTFGLSIEEYDALLQSQNNCCASCGVHMSTQKRNLAVDHCHSTGKIRGLLCTNCNIGLGMFKDDVNLLQKAIEYLEKKKYGTK